MQGIKQKLLDRLVAGLQDFEGDSDEESAYTEDLDSGQLERRAAAAAAGHHRSDEPGHGWLLLPRFIKSRQTLTATHAALVAALSSGREVSPAAECFVSNFRVIEAQLSIVSRHLTRGYYAGMPCLRDGAHAGWPRVYAVAHSLIAHTHSRLDAERLKRFLGAYQRVAPLTIKELRAFELTLRLVLVERLSRLAASVAGAQAEYEAADAFADRLLGLNGQRAREIPDLLFASIGGDGTPRSDFVLQVAGRLGGQNSEARAALDRLETYLRRRGQSVEQVTHAGRCRQSASREEMDNILASILSLSTLDWQEFFASVSLVDGILGEDPSGVYSLMEFTTRDRYRRVVERVAKRTRAGEAEVARRVARMAAGVHEAAAPERAHVGFYLLDDGLAELEKVFNYRPGLAERVVRLALRYPAATYLGTRTLITAAFVLGCVIYASRRGASLPVLVAVSLLSLVPASELALSALRLVFTTIFAPRALPRIDTSAGVPREAMTMVVVPTIFSSEASVRESLETIEAHYLANQDGNIFFALLGDWAAAPREEMPGDGALLDAALDGIRELNARYHDGPRDRFYLFHRRRQWNAGEREWIGWEKKRGKLREFNRLLRGARDTSFVVSTAESAFLARVRYVITLDSDTQLPRGAARKLVGNILHPLNRPRLDAETNRVVRGYGVFQPRVVDPQPKAARSRLPLLLSHYAGTTPFADLATTPAPNLDQDLFGEGIYVGKGLYDVDVFEFALRDRIPENSLLSHDLLEGLYARAALVSDVEIFDDQPPHYAAFAKRSHRWTRGDWQLLPWLWPRVRDARGTAAGNVLPLIGRWRILDNLRRSLVAPATLLWLVAAWSVLPGSTALWTALILLTFTAPVYLHFTSQLLIHISKNRQVSLLGSAWAVVKVSTLQALLSVSYLAHQAYLMTDAITRVLYRLFVSRKRLLEWVTAAQAQQEGGLTPGNYFRYMWPAAGAAACAALAVAYRAQSFTLAAPFLFAWLSSPLIACWRSRRVREGFKVLEERVEREARLSARYMWRLYGDSVDDPPVLEDARPGLEPDADRHASPVSLGRRLVWTVAAHDLGVIGTLELAERLEAALTAMENCQAFSGRRVLSGPAARFEALTPPEVMMAEAGNPAAFLCSLERCCVALTELPLFSGGVIEGAADTLLLLKQAVKSLSASAPAECEVILRQLNEEAELCLAYLGGVHRAGAPQTFTSWKRLLDTLVQRAAIVELMSETVARQWPASVTDELRYWADSLARQARELSRDLHLLAPWVQVRTAHLVPVIRGRSTPALARWSRFMEELDTVPATSRLPERLDALLGELSDLSADFGRFLPAGSTDSATVLNGCGELKSALKDARSTASVVCSRYARSAARSRVIADAEDFRSRFDEERRVLRSQFEISALR
jgi:cyclic beta-1,2-glucan synthetase